MIPGFGVGRGIVPALPGRSPIKCVGEGVGERSNPDEERLKGIPFLGVRGVGSFPEMPYFLAASREINREEMDARPKRYQRTRALPQVRPPPKTGRQISWPG